MHKDLVCFLAIAITLLGGAAEMARGEKVRFATPAMIETYYLPLMAAQEQGLWQKNGIELEWLPIRGTTPMFQAAAARHIDMGGNVAIGLLPAVARGVPVVVVSSLAKEDFFLWVRTKGRIATASDLKGAKVAVSTLGGTPHAYGLAAARALGLGKEIRFVATGGPRESLAAFISGAVDGMVTTLRTMLKLKLAGEARELVAIGEYLPKEWAGFVVFARRDFLDKNRDAVRRTATGLVQATNFILGHPAWAIKKMQSQAGYSEAEARMVLESATVFSPDGILASKELENVRNFVIEYGIVPTVPDLASFYQPVFPGPIGR